MKKLNRKKQAKETQRENKLEERPQPRLSRTECNPSAKALS